jgi:hypothetical protein
MWKAIQKILENTSLVVVVLGLVLFVIAAAGTVPFTAIVISEPTWRIALSILGVIVAVGGSFYMWFGPRQPERIDWKSYGVKIEHPLPGDLIDEHFDVSGTYKKELPNNLRIEVIEIDADRTAIRYRPRKTAFIEDGRRWRAAHVFGGSEKESGRSRLLFVALVGKSGQSLIDYYGKVGETYNYKDRPSIDRLTEDVYECDRVRVRRK